MKASRFLIPLAVVVALAASGCGGSGKVPKGAAAVVGGESVSIADVDALLLQAKKSYESQKRTFPKAGSVEYQTLKNQALAFLLQRVEFEQKLKDLGGSVTDKQVADRLVEIKKQYFNGDEKKYRKQLADQGLTDAQVRADLRSQLVSEAIFTAVTKDVAVSDKDVTDYYAKNQSTYSQPESRDVRHILVKTKAEADKLYAQLKSGADFTALAKKYSQDPGSKDKGGKLTITKGSTVAPFDETAFMLPKDALSRPVKTQYGYHIIQPLSEVRPAKQTPLKDVRESIKQQLLQTKRNDKMTAWVDDVKKKYEGKVRFAAGFQPLPVVTTGAATTG